MKVQSSPDLIAGFIVSITSTLDREINAKYLTVILRY